MISIPSNLYKRFWYAHFRLMYHKNRKMIHHLPSIFYLDSKLKKYKMIIGEAKIKMTPETRRQARWTRRIEIWENVNSINTKMNTYVTRPEIQTMQQRTRNKHSDLERFILILILPCPKDFILFIDILSLPISAISCGWDFELQTNYSFLWI